MSNKVRNVLMKFGRALAPGAGTIGKRDDSSQLTQDGPRRSGPATRGARSRLAAALAIAASALVALPAHAQSDLVTTKTLTSSPTPTVGDPVIYDITVTNNGTANATNVVITDLLPAGVTFFSVVEPAGTTYNQSTGEWAVGSLANGASTTLTITAFADLSGNGSIVTNTVSSVTADQADPTTVGDDLSATVTIPSTPILPFSSGPATCSASGAEAGAITYSGATGTTTLPSGTVTVTNSVDVPGALISGTTTTNADIFDGPEYTRITNDGGVLLISYSGALITGLDSTHTQSFSGVDVFEVFAHFNSLDQIDFVALASDNPGVGFEVVSGSDDALETDPTGDVRVSDVIRNDGDGNFVDAGLDGNLGRSADFTVRFFSTTSSPISQIVWRITEEPTELRPASAGDGWLIATEVCAVPPGADLQTVKTLTSSPTPAIGDPVIYDITVTNNGPLDATNVSLTDQLPTGVSFITVAEPAGTTYNQTTGEWAIGSLANGASTTLTITGFADLDGNGNTVTNTVTSVTADQPDPTTVGDDLDATITIPSTPILPFSSGPATCSAAGGAAGAVAYSGVTGTATLPNGTVTVTNSAVGAPAISGTTSSNADIFDGPEYTRVTNDDGVLLVSYSGTFINGLDSTHTQSFSGVDVFEVFAHFNSLDQLNLVALAADNPGVGFEVVSGSDDALDTDPSGDIRVSDVIRNDSDGNFVDAGLDGNLGRSADFTVRFFSTTSSPISQIVWRITEEPPELRFGQGDGWLIATEVCTALPVSDLVTTKTLLSGETSTPAVGDPVTFEITVTNNGVEDATNVTLTDQLPTGLTFPGGGALGGPFNVPSTGTYDEATGIWTLGSLANGASATLELTAIVEPGAQGSAVTNSAVAASTPDQFDPSTAGDDLDETLNVVGAPAFPFGTAQTCSVAGTTAGAVTYASGVGTSTFADGTITVTNTAVGGPAITTDTTTNAAIFDGPEFSRLTSDAGLVNTFWNAGVLGGLDAVHTQAFSGGDVFEVFAQFNSIDQFDLFILAADNPGVGFQVLSGSDDALDVDPSGDVRVVDAIRLDRDTSVAFEEADGNAGQSADVSVRFFSTTSAPISQIVWRTVESPQASRSGNVDGWQLATEICADFELADLVTTKTLASGSSATPAISDTVGYEITVTNNGPLDATNVTLTDTLPAGLTATGNNGGVTAGTYTAGTGVWDIPSLANGASATLTLEGTVDLDQGGQTITNTLAAPASGDQADPGTTGDDLTASVAVTVPADTTIPAPSCGAPGGATFTGLSFTSLDPVGVIQNDYRLENAGVISGQVVDLLVNFSPTPARAFGSEPLQVPALTGDNFTFNGGNNLIATYTVVATGTTTPVSGNFLLRIGDLDISETVAFDNTQFSAFRTNDPTNISISTVGTTTTLTGAPGTRETVAEDTLEFVVVGRSSFSLNFNPVQSHSGPGYTLDGNNDLPLNAGLCQSLLPTADLVTTKALASGSSATPAIGDTVGFEITVTNNGPAGATNVTLTDTLPAGLTATGNNGGVTAGTYTAGTGVWDIPSLANGASATLTLEGTVDAGQDGQTITNTLAAPATSDEIDPATGGDDLTESVTVDNEITATADTVGSAAGGATDVINVLANDTVDGVAATTSNVILTETVADPAGVLTLNPDGSVDVAAAAPAGTYTLTYQICETANPTNCETGTVTITVDAAPSLSVAKTLDSNADEDSSGTVTVGDTLTYTITATNDGNAPQTDVVVTDNLLTPSSATCPTVAINGTCVLTGTLTVTAAQVNAGSVDNTAEAESNEVTTPEPSNTVNTGAVLTPLAATADTVTSAPGTGVINVLANDTLNGGGATTSNVTLTETVADPAGVLTLNADGSVDVAANAPAGDYMLTYQICETANPANCQTATVTVTVPADNSLSVVKTLDSNADEDSSGTVTVGDTLTYTITATNDGNAPQTNVVVTDNLLTPSSITCPTVAINGTCVLTGTLTVSAAQANAGSVDNTAEAESDEVTTPVPSNTVNTGAVLTPLAATADTVTSAPGTGVINVLANDTLNGGGATTSNVTLTETVADPAGVLTLNADGSVDVAANAPVGDYMLTYQICETANPANCQTATVTVTVPADNSLSVVKTLDSNADEDSSGTVTVGDTLTYTITATNDGNAPQTNVVVTDNLLTPSSITCPTVAINGTCVLTGTHVVTSVEATAGTVNNTAEAASSEVTTPESSNTVTTSVDPAIDAQDDIFTGSPISGLTGGTTPTVFTNDTLNGVPVANGDVEQAVLVVNDDTSTATSLVFTINADGEISIPAGTPAGDYQIIYEICQAGMSTGPGRVCSTATTEVTVSAPALDAVADTLGPVNGADGGTTPSLLANDTLNGSPVDPADVDFTVDAVLGPDGNPSTAITVNPDGTVTIPTGTPAGDYTVTYTVCETLNPTNCDTVSATVTVAAPAIDATPVGLGPINGADGGETPSVLDTVTLNGTPADPADVTITDFTADPAVQFEPTTGVITVPAGTPAGTYEVTFTVCETLNPTNCVTVTETVTVDAPAIVAGDDDFAAVDVDGVSGGTTPSVLANDTLNNAPVDASAISLQLVSDGGLTGVTLNADGTLNIPADTPAGTFQVTYEICEVTNPDNCDTGTATVSVATTIAISGVVFSDINGDDVQQPNEPLLEGIEVQIRDETGAVIATAITDENGTYEVSDLVPGTFDVLFSDPDTGTVIGGIMGVEALAGEIVIDQNLPIDPSGVIYDAETGDPIEGVLAVLTDASGVPLPEVCFIDASQQNQVTGADGNYRFDLVPGASPACPLTETEYRLEVTLPGGLPTIFAFEPEAAPLDATTCPIDAIPGGACQVFGEVTAPAPGVPSIFFTSFLLETGDPNVINNHVPINLSVANQPLVASKTSTTATAGTGGIVPYTITVSNPQATPALGIDIVDVLPVGFRFVDGSALLNGEAVAPEIVGTSLIWTDIDIPANSSVTVNLSAIVGAGVTTGDFANQAFAQAGLTGAPLSNVATATVRIEPDEIFDCSEIIGKVFDDRNGNGIQDEDEPGLPGVRVTTVKGLLVTTDAFGRYHIACAATPRAGIGSNFILKLDERTLPADYEVTTENPRVVRLTEGKLTSIDFGVEGPRRVRVDLTDAAFVSDSNELLAEYGTELTSLVEMLAETRSVLILAYSGPGDGQARLTAVEAQIREIWGDQPYDLNIETEVTSHQDGEGK